MAHHILSNFKFDHMHLFVKYNIHLFIKFVPSLWLSVSL